MTIIAATVYKPSADVKVGITFQRIPGGTTLLVSKISEGGLFAKSDLRPGMKVTSINNKNAENMNAQIAAKIIKSAVGVVTVTADDTTTFAVAATTGVTPLSTSHPPPGVPDGTLSILLFMQIILTYI